VKDAKREEGEGKELAAKNAEITKREKEFLATDGTGYTDGEGRDWKFEIGEHPAGFEE
jgi:hypothetical protein